MRVVYKQYNFTKFLTMMIRKMRQKGGESIKYSESLTWMATIISVWRNYITYNKFSP